MSDMKSVFIGVLLFGTVAWLNVVPVGAEGVQNSMQESQAASEPLISVKASRSPVVKVLESIAKQGKKTVLVESSAAGEIDLNLEGLTFTQALDQICFTAKLQWREVYLEPDSEYLKQPDKLAAVVRLTTGVGLPNVVVNNSSLAKTGIYINDKETVNKASSAVIEQLKMQQVYVVTNDAGIITKVDEQSKVEQYMDLAKKQLDMLVNMTPDELEKALTAGLMLSEQMDPGYMVNIMHTLMKTDPEALRRMVYKQNQLIFDMSQEDRRAMIKLGMQMQVDLTPEQIQMIQEDTLAVLEELNLFQGQE